MGTSSWYVLTGGPSSGKTTLLERLQELGYHTVSEAARVVIDEYRAKGIPVSELRKDERLFQQHVMQVKLETEERTPKGGPVFFDRGIPDSIAYYQVCGLDTQEIEKVSGSRYRRVFFLEQLPFHYDYARTEDESTARRLSQLLLESYENLGYDIVHVPVL